MYLQLNKPDLDSINSVRMKIEDRLRSLASVCKIDNGPSFSLRELSIMLSELNSLSPTEFRAVKYIMDICDRADNASRVDHTK